MSRRKEKTPDTCYLGFACIARYDYVAVASSEKKAWELLRQTVLDHLGREWVRANHGSATKYLEYVGARVTKRTMNTCEDE